MPHSRDDEAPYWVTVPAPPPPAFPGPPVAAPGGWPAAPQATHGLPGTGGGWVAAPPRPAPGPSAWCTASLALGLLSLLVIAAQGGLYGGAAVLLVATVALSFTALTVTWGDAPTNRWMAVTGLLLGALPLVPAALTFAFLWLLFYGPLG